MSTALRHASANEDRSSVARSLDPSNPARPESEAARLSREIGRRINDERTSARESVIHLGAATDTNLRTIYQVERGEYANVKIGTVLKLLDHYGLTLAVVPKSSQNAAHAAGVSQ